MVRRKKIILFLLFIAILLCSYVEYDYQEYIKNKPVDTSVVEVAEGLSINYLQGKKIVVNQNSMEYDFSITNLGNEEKKYQLEIKNLEGDATGSLYDIKEDNTVIKEITSVMEGIVLNGSIEAGKTKRYHMQIQNKDKREFSFVLNTICQSVDDSFRSVLLSNNKVLEEGEDGLIEKPEQDGTIYYFKGNVDNNYVSFAGNMWRIVRINTDQSVKLVLDNTLGNMAKYFSDEQSGLDDFEDSNIYQLLLDFYNINLKDYDSFIANTLYCYDNSILTEEDNKIEYLPSYRLFVDKIPTYSCSGKSIPLKVALLTSDEVVFAGASSDESKNYYLNGEFQSSWWTMTPSKKENGKMHYMVITKDGILQKDVVESTSLFFRPVISLNRRVRVEGSGTIEEPYVVISEQ